jgi:copper(I)-binding protein
MTMTTQAFVLALATMVITATVASADPNGIEVSQAWARATPGQAKTGVIYLTITNHGTAPDTLQGDASSPAAAHADLH